MLTCPHRNETYNGNCEFCNERSDCMLRDIMQKLQELETTVKQMKAVSVK